MTELQCATRLQLVQLLRDHPQWCYDVCYGYRVEFWLKGHEWLREAIVCGDTDYWYTHGARKIGPFPYADPDCHQQAFSCATQDYLELLKFCSE